MGEEGGGGSGGEIIDSSVLKKKKSVAEGGRRCAVREGGKARQGKAVRLAGGHQHQHVPTSTAQPTSPRTTRCSLLRETGRAA